MPINTAADAVNLATDALAALDACQELHAELVACVAEFNARGER